ncbi:MAG: homocysteine S-methyltransferase family protein [Pseudomonadota bacterium]
MTHSVLYEKPAYYLTDGGLETTLIFENEIDLPLFAAFPLIETPQGQETLRAYFEQYIEIARSAGCGFVLESATWRSSPDWGKQLDCDGDRLNDVNQRHIELLRGLRDTHASARLPMIISGCVGPRGDGYNPGQVMTHAEATAYHAQQIQSFAQAGVDMISAITMTNTPEALGIVTAARAANVPCVISFTVETDGHLPTGQSLADAIAAVDQETNAYPSYYMINCAHPTHFAHRIEAGAGWTSRIGGIRANASCKSHAELDEAETLDRGCPHDLGAAYADLARQFPNLRVLGGCCGTDKAHIQAIAKSVVSGELVPT